MGNCYLAQQAGRNSAKYVVEGNRKAWLDLFADDAVVEDPVGISPLDPAGSGHRGKEAIAAFWDMTIRDGLNSFEIRESHPAGDECANVVTLSNTMPDGTVLTADLVAVYRANDLGKIVSMKAYWDYSKLEEELAGVVGPGD